jgi:hypothetical protein
VTPANGWTNGCSSCSNAVDLDSPDQTSDVFYAGTSAGSSDASTELASFIQAISQGSNATFSNFQTVGNVNAGNLNANAGGFTEAAYVQFTGTQSTSQGTQAFVGIVGVFLNAPAGFEVVESMESVSATDLQNNLADLNAMNGSIIGS